jgi:competence protein ComEA
MSDSAREKDVKFNKNAKRIISIFAFCMLIVLLLPRFFLFVNEKPKIVVIQTTAEKIDQENFKKTGFAPKYNSARFSKKEKYRSLTKKTDPNQMTVADWITLGASDKQAQSIVKFKDRIKGFKKLEDVEKLFTLPKPLFALIKDSLIFNKNASTLPENKVETVEKTQEKVKIPKNKIEINGASEDELTSISGIGPYFAKAIIKRRIQLGGFIHLEQLKEIWKIDEEKYQAISPFMAIDVSKVKRININSATAEQLKALNYISWNVANSIVKIRSQHGDFKTVKDIQKSVLIDDELFLKIKDYLVVN